MALRTTGHDQYGRYGTIEWHPEIDDGVWLLVDQGTGQLAANPDGSQPVTWDQNFGAPVTVVDGKPMVNVTTDEGRHQLMSDPLYSQFGLNDDIQALAQNVAEKDGQFYAPLDTYSQFDSLLRDSGYTAAHKPNQGFIEGATQAVTEFAPAAALTMAGAYGLGQLLAPAAAGGAGLGTMTAEQIAAELAGLGASTTELATGVGTMGGAAAGAGGLTLSQLLQGAGTGLNLGNVLQGALTGVGGYLAADKTADTLQNIYNQQRADRQPALSAFNEALANPDTWYQSAPAMGASTAAANTLSAGGNPALQPALFARLAAHNLGGYTNYLGNMGNLGLGGQATQAQLGSQLAGAQGGGYEAIGAGLGSMFKPQNSLEDLLKSLPKMNWGGLNSLT